MRTKPLEKVNDLTKREYFAGVALQGLASRFPYLPEADLVERAVKIADNLIEELNKQDK